MGVVVDKGGDVGGLGRFRLGCEKVVVEGNEGRKIVTGDGSLTLGASCEDVVKGNS